MILELVEQADDVGPVHLQRGGESLLGAVTAIPQHRQRDKMARPQAQWCQHCLGTHTHATREVVEQRAGTVHRLVDHRQGTHM